MTEDEKKLKVDRSLAKRKAQKELKEELDKLNLNIKSSEWSFMEDLAQEIEATYASTQKKISATEMVAKMQELAVRKYEEYEGLPEKIIASIPSIQRIIEWRKKKNWREAVWQKCRETEIFSNENRALVHSKLLDKIKDKGDVQAMKLYFQMSGDLVEKDEKANKIVDLYKEINDHLHGNKA